jgi:hypothetical protein
MPKPPSQPTPVAPPEEAEPITLEERLLALKIPDASSGEPRTAEERLVWLVVRAGALEEVERILREEKVYTWVSAPAEVRRLVNGLRVEFHRACESRDHAKKRAENAEGRASDLRLQVDDLIRQREQASELIGGLRQELTEARILRRLAYRREES